MQKGYLRENEQRIPDIYDGKQNFMDNLRHSTKQAEKQSSLPASLRKTYVDRKKKLIDSKNIFDMLLNQAPTTHHFSTLNQAPMTFNNSLGI